MSMKKKLAELRAALSEKEAAIDQLRGAMHTAENGRNLISAQIRALEDEIKAAKPLTAKQAELLRAMRAGVEVARMEGWKNQSGYYWRRDTHRKCTNEVAALCERKLVERVGRYPGKVALTELGKAKEVA